VPLLAGSPLLVAEAHPLVDALLARAPGALGGCDRAIHRDDEMLSHALAMRHGDLDAALVDYFREGLQVALSVRQVAQWRWGGLGAVGSMLDFASGGGRVTRFLVRELAAERLAVSDIQSGAIAFQAQRFGVRALPSAPHAAEFRCAQRFDLVWVTSLFSHLPEGAFQAWLRRLLDCLAPHGLLAISVHDPSVLRPQEAFPETGFLFRPLSESRALDTEAYGSSFVSESYLRAAVESAAPGAWCCRLPRALSNFQDLYLLAREAPPLAAPRLDLAPFGHLDQCRRTATGELFVSGWAAQWNGEVPTLVTVRLNGHVVASVREFALRPDVLAAHRGLPHASGFAARCAASPELIAGRAILEVEATSSAGVSASLFLGTVAAAEIATLRTELGAASEERAQREGWFEHVEAELRRMVAEREARLAAMRQSRFWRAREAWFRCKRVFGVGPEN
jgi:SAM-dependent methyltransferase